MSEKLESAISILIDRLGGKEAEGCDPVAVIVPPEQIVEACRILRDEFGCDMLLNETAVDYWPQQTPRFHLVYQVYSMKDNILLGLRVPLDGNAPHISTIEGIYPNANWHEREVWDMFGVRFDDHSDLRRILMPHDWEGFPQRKDYPLGYEEVQFTFNYEEIKLSKPYAKE
jgi:NADH-quinone oxidoreductase subunit C